MLLGQLSTSAHCVFIHALFYLIALRRSPPLCWARFFFWWWWWGGVCACYTVMKAWEHSGIVDQTLPHRGMQIVSHYKHSTHADIMKWVFMKTLISNTVLAFIYLLFPCCERNMGDLTTLTRTFTLSMGIRCKYKLDCSYGPCWSIAFQGAADWQLCRGSYSQHVRVFVHRQWCSCDSPTQKNEPREPACLKGGKKENP